MLEVALPICFLQVSGHQKSKVSGDALVPSTDTEHTLSTTLAGGEVDSGLLPKLKSVTECCMVNCAEQSDYVCKK